MPWRIAPDSVDAPCALADRARFCSNCPNRTWDEAVRPVLLQRAGAAGVTLLNVGANKGFNLAEWMQRNPGAVTVDQLTKAKAHFEVLRTQGTSSCPGTRVHLRNSLCHSISHLFVAHAHSL